MLRVETQRCARPPYTPFCGEIHLRKKQKQPQTPFLASPRYSIFYFFFNFFLMFQTLQARPAARPPSLALSQRLTGPVGRLL